MCLSKYESEKVLRTLTVLTEFQHLFREFDLPGFEFGLGFFPGGGAWVFE